LIKQFRLCMFALISVMIFTACGAGAPTSTAPADIVDDTAKYNAYIELLNFVDGWFSGFVGVYFHTFDIEGELNTDVDFSRFFNFGEHDMMELHGRHSAAARYFARQEPDWGAVDAYMLRFADAVDNLLTLYFVEARNYYLEQEYLADNFEQGRLIHTRMMDYYDNMFLAFDDFILAFQPIIMLRQGADLPRFEEAGMMLHFYALRLVLTGMEVNSFFNILDAQGVAFLDTPLEKIEALHSLMVSDMVALQEIYTDAERQEAEGFSENGARFIPIFVSTAQEMTDFLTETVELLRGGTYTTVPLFRFQQRVSDLIGRYNIIVN